MSLIITNLCKSFGSKEVLKDLSLDVPMGKNLVIMGCSGSGKSVLLKCILGLIPIDNGEVYFNKIGLSGMSQKDRQQYLTNFGMLFQGSALFDSLSIWENVCFNAIMQEKISKKKAQEQAINLIKQVGLSDDVAFMYPGELSGGMQRRVAIARAIATNPRILLFDEPTAGLDPIISNTINDLILQCSQGKEQTSITITHDLKSARHIADVIVLLHDGSVKWLGNANELDHTTDPYIAQFIHGSKEGPINQQKL